MYNSNDNSVCEELQAVYDKFTVEEGFKIRNQQDVITYFNVDAIKSKNEIFRALFLDNAHRVIDKVTYKGTVNRCTVYPRKVFARAFRAGASAMIISHNHPGDNLEFSASDKKLTSDLVKAGKIVDVKLLDHILITSKGSKSMRESREWPI